MQYYKTKAGKLPGTSYKEVHKQARAVFNQIKKRTKRKPYIRSAYFNKQKIFFDFFWVHIAQKREPDRVRRLKYFQCAIEVVKNSRINPKIMQNPANIQELLHKFGGVTKEKEKFIVQIKENVRTNRKQLMSIFPRK